MMKVVESSTWQCRMATQNRMHSVLNTFTGLISLHPPLSYQSRDLLHGYGRGASRELPIFVPFN